MVLICITGVLPGGKLNGKPRYKDYNNTVFYLMRASRAHFSTSHMGCYYPRRSLKRIHYLITFLTPLRYIDSDSKLENKVQNSINFKNQLNIKYGLSN